MDRRIAQFPFQHPLPGDNVVDLSFYRRRRKLRRPLPGGALQRPGDDAAIAEADDEYFQRMKINAAAFAVVVVLIAIGIWLVNGIAQAAHHLA